MKRKILAMLLAVALIGTMVFAPATAASDTSINVEIDGVAVKLAIAPVREGGTTLVPLRFFTEYLGAEVSYTNGVATIETAAYTVVFTIDSMNYTVNGASKTISTGYAPPRLINGNTMVPLRFLFESIGATVTFDSATDTAKVSYFTGVTGDIKVSGSTTVYPIMVAATDMLMEDNSGLSITVAGGGSGVGIQDTKDGNNTIGMASSDLKEADLDAGLIPIEVAKDAVAIIVHPDNPVQGLTKDQAAKIFTGEIKNWNEVGGNNAPILVQTRETGSGTLTTMLDLLTSKVELVASATPHNSSALILNAVAADVNAIGFDSIGYLDSSVKALELDDVMPSDTTVKDASYPLSRSLWVFTKGTATGANAILIDYLRSDIVQAEIVVPEGYISFR